MSIPSSLRAAASLVALTTALAQTTSTVSAQTTNPYPDPIAQSDFVVEVSDFASIPGWGGPPRLHHLTATPDGRILVVDQLGPAWMLTADGSRVSPYLDLSRVPGIALVRSAEQGFQSLAFHPEFVQPGAPGFGKFYTAHTSADTGPPADFVPGQGSDACDYVVLEWTAADPVNATTFSPARREAPFREVLRIEAPFGNHSIGLVAFNPNATSGSADFGKLYIAIGDGGAGGDPFHLAANPANPFGSILRIDPLATDGKNGRYGIPADNPFAGGKSRPDGALPEIYAYGLRNPQRFSWDRGGEHRMFISDIGQNFVEEINVGSPGANYGWNSREGSFRYEGGQVGPNVRGDAAASGLTYPTAEYGHQHGLAVTAGFVERSGRIPELAGKFIFGDLARGHIYFIDADKPPDGGQDGVTQIRLRHRGRERSFLDIIRTVNRGAGRADLRFGTNPQGRIFLYNKQDGVIRLLGGPGAP